MNLRLIKANDMKRMPWKNGGGETLEVAISPAGAELSRLDFNWRVSIAMVGSDGPFSQFPGYARTLVVWSGEGLLVNGVTRSPLQPFSFSGADAIDAKLMGGPVKDFGLIAKSGSFRSEMTVHSLSENATSAAEVNGDTFILCTRGELRIGGFYLNPGDVVHASGVGTVQVTALERADLVIASVT